jgi:hypothetical protein
MSERRRSAGRAEANEADGKGDGRDIRRAAAEGGAEKGAGGGRQRADSAPRRLTEGTVSRRAMMPRAHLCQTSRVACALIRAVRGIGNRRANVRLRVPVRQPRGPEQRKLGDDEPECQPTAAWSVPCAARMVHNGSPPLAPIIQAAAAKRNPRN